MAYPSITNSNFVNGTTSDADQLDQNFLDLVNGLSDGTKDLNMNNGTFAGDVAVSGSVDLGSNSSDTISVNGVVDTDIVPSANATKDLGSATAGMGEIYLGNGTNTVKQVAATLTGDRVATFPNLTGTVMLAIPGMISAYGGATAPSGWLLCDGTSYVRGDYADLYSIIGTAFGTADITHFNVPDLRGRFLRGKDAAVGRDPDRATRTAMNTGGATGDNVGSVQAAGTKLPTTNFTTPSTATGGRSADHSHVEYGNSGGGGQTGGQTGGGVSGSLAWYHSTGGASADHTHTLPAMIVAGGDSETRPINAYVNYIIKY
jgi:microcystin-dependent protein